MVVTLPKLGKRKVAEITRRDIETLHITYVDRPYRANRVLALLSAAHLARLESDAALSRRFRGRPTAEMILRIRQRRRTGTPHRIVLSSPSASPTILTAE